MIVISNTGPLIALAKLDQLSLLNELVPAGVFIPEAVQRELWAKAGFEADALEAALEGFIQVSKPEHVSDQVRFITHSLDKGEQQVVQLAASLDEERFVLLDDYAGRKAAKQLNLVITGTAGLLIRAKKKGLVPTVIPLLENLREHNYWLSDELIEHVRDLVNE